MEYATSQVLLVSVIVALVTALFTLPFSLNDEDHVSGWVGTYFAVAYVATSVLGTMASCAEPIWSAVIATDIAAVVVCVLCWLLPYVIPRIFKR